MELSDISFDDFIIDPTTDLNRLVRLEKHHRTSAYNTRYWLELPRALQIGTGRDAVMLPYEDPHYVKLMELLSHWAQCQIAMAHHYAERRSSLMVSIIK